MKKIPLFLSIIIFPNIDFNFSLPFGIGIDKSGMVYIANSGNGMIKKYSPDGKLCFEFMSWQEDKPGNPRDVAVNKKGDIYILDCWNNKVSVFSYDGKFKMDIGGLGEGFGRFKFPSSLAIDDEDYIYVVDSGNGVVHKFSPEGKFIMEFGRDTGLKFPQGIAIEKDIYISCSGNNRIVRFSKEGEFVSVIRGIKNPSSLCFSPDRALYVVCEDSCIMKEKDGKFIPLIKDLSNPSDIAISDDSIWVAETGKNRILKFSISGILEGIWESSGSSLERLNFPYDIACSNSSIYIADCGNNRILMMSEKFKPKDLWSFPSPIAIFAKNENIYCLSKREDVCIKFDKFGNELLRIENLNFPKDVVVNDNGEIFILSSLGILKFSSLGKPIGTISVEGDPSCIALDNFGSIIVSFEDKIKVFSSSGVLIKTIKNLFPFSDITVDKDNNIYGVEKMNNRILKLDFYGNILKVIDNPKFFYPSGITIDEDENLYIADSGNHRIVVFAKKGDRFSEALKEVPKFYLPELVVNEIKILEPKAHEWIKVEVSIENQGNKKADFVSVDFFSNKGRIGFGKFIRTISPKEIKTISTILKPEYGTNTIKVIVDQENMIREVNKMNNIKEKEIFVW